MRFQKIKLRIIAVVLVAVLITANATQVLAGSSFLRKLGNVLEFVHNANQVLWLLGDPASERRFGYLMSRFLMGFYKIDKDPQRNAYVQKIFQRVVDPARRRNFQYRAYVVNSKEINAFALPGGYIFINRGMLDFVKSDDELACVIGHELAHVNRRHSLNRLRRNYAFIALINKLFDDNTSADRRNDTVAKVTWLFLEQKNSRNNEREADALGMEWSMKAGYNPSGMVTLWERMEKKYPHQKDALTKMLSTHPPHRERSSNARKLIAKWGLTFSETDFLTIGVTPGKESVVKIDGTFNKTNRTYPSQDSKKSVTDWSFSKGTSTSKNSGRNNSPCLVIQRTDQSQECTVKSSPFPFTSSSAATVSASVKAATPDTKVWIGMEFLDTNKEVIDVSFFVADGILTVPDTWITFSKRLESQSGVYTIPRQTKLAQVVIAGAEEQGQTLLIDNVTILRQDAKDSIAEPLEGPVAPKRGTVRKNLLPNGSFEVDSDGNKKPDNWICSGGSRITFEKPSHGASGIKLEGLKEGRREFAVSERIPVKGSSRYVLTGWFKSQRPTDIDFGVRVFSRDYREIIEGQDLRTHRVSRNVWTIKEQRVTVPGQASNNYYIQVWIRAIPEPGKKVFADNISLFNAEVR